MNDEIRASDTLQDIKKIMERSSRFISLSGLSGIAAGACALVGAWFAHKVISHSNSYFASGRGESYEIISTKDTPTTIIDFMGNRLFIIGAVTFAAAFIFAFLFTYLRSKKTYTPIWGYTAQKLMWNVCVPMFVGGLFLLKMIQAGIYGFIAPGCLIFYGLALVNATKHTLPEIKYLGYGQLITGVINLWFIGQGLWFWTFGFGILHIAYGAIMWWKYERISEKEEL